MSRSVAAMSVGSSSEYPVSASTCTAAESGLSELSEVCRSLSEVCRRLCRRSVGGQLSESVKASVGLCRGCRSI